MVVDLEIGPNDEICGVRTFFGVSFHAKAAVLTTGTFMNGRIWVGKTSMAAGRLAFTSQFDGIWCLISVLREHVLSLHKVV